jgi:VanZ family protein
MRKLISNARWGIGWGIFILMLTGIPGWFVPKIPQFFDLFRPDKLVHVFMFQVLVFLLALGFRKEGNPAPVMRYPLLVSMVISLFLSGFTELMQAWFIPLRIGSPYDFIANVLGCMIGWLTWWGYIKKKRGSEIVK